VLTSPTEAYLHATNAAFEGASHHTNIASVTALVARGCADARSINNELNHATFAVRGFAKCVILHVPARGACVVLQCRLQPPSHFQIRAVARVLEQHVRTLDHLWSQRVALPSTIWSAISMGFQWDRRG
jgi:hypothetical protein